MGAGRDADGEEEDHVGEHVARMIYEESVTRALPAPQSRKRSVQGVAEPIDQKPHTTEP
jgi:hypothetical protein